MRDDVDRLRSTVDRQELSQEDVRRMRASASAMRERMGATLERREAVTKDVGAGAEELKKRLGSVRARGGSRRAREPTLTHPVALPATSPPQLDARLRDYHDRARMLQLVPKGAKYSFGVDFSLSLDPRALERVAAPAYGADEGDRRAAASALVGADMKGVIKKNMCGGVATRPASRARPAHSPRNPTPPFPQPLPQDMLCEERKRLADGHPRRGDRGGGGQRAARGARAEHRGRGDVDGGARGDGAA